MRKQIKIMPLTLLLLMGCSSDEITINSLLDEMTCRTTITYMPDFRLKQASSYDRSTTGAKDSTWFANWDRSMFYNQKKINGNLTEYTMLESNEPGAIVRFWMTFAGENCGNGELKIFIDGDTVPSISGNALGILSGGDLVGAPLATSVSKLSDYKVRGHNLYLPIPYAKSCKVTYTTANVKDSGAKTGGECVYYNIAYRVYPENTRIESYSAKVLAASKEKIEKTNRILQQNERKLQDLFLEKHPFPRSIKAGESESVIISNSQSAIHEITLKMLEGDISAIQRKLVMEIIFDNQKSVWVPAGDFFGCGYQFHTVNNWYTSVDSTGTLSSYWVMPFKKECKVTLHNFSDQQIDLEDAYVCTAPYNWKNNSMYFGAGWKQLTNIDTGVFKNNEGGGGAYDINYVTLTGTGVYAGDGIALFNTVNAWWGEGDEKIFVDNETFPSSIGTGTEDYYGYAWCREEKFIGHPFISQPCGEGNFRPGYTYNLRYRDLDVIPFKDKIQVDMEMWHWVKAKINFAPIAIWYMLPGGESNLPEDWIGIKQKLANKSNDIIE